jgi:hypothetical protein
VIQADDEGTVRAQQLNETDRSSMMDVLTRIETAGVAIATELQADIRIEKDDRGKAPSITFRAYGPCPMRAEPLTQPGRIRGT